ncbi:MAG TPA: hypothetical protein VG821_11390 [Rhizomicrobium sp.]|jgi:hypothetical protein|nr:hypothetical protein [Rhizomicrobium sp.]
MGTGIFLNRFCCSPKDKNVRRWMVILLVVALLATIAGFLAFGGADMGVGH